MFSSPVITGVFSKEGLDGGVNVEGGQVRERGQALVGQDRAWWTGPGRAGQAVVDRPWLDRKELEAKLITDIHHQ